MKLKFVAAAVLVATASIAAQADGVIGSGPLTIPSTWTVSGSLSGIGSIDSVWTFETAAASSANAAASNSYVVFGDAIFNQIGSFAAFVDGNQLTPEDDFVTPIGGGNKIVEQKLTIVPFTLGAGLHTFKISGTVGAGGGSYSATLSLAPAPVPEPETYAMMLAGLGALGFLARRRQS